MTNLYHNLAAAKDALRTAKDYYDTTKAICEWHVMTTGKNEADRKRELIVALASDEAYGAALNELREAEAALDQAQAAIDQAEDERRDREWAIRAKLAEALSRQHEDAAFEQVSDQRLFIRSKIAAEKANLDDLYPTK